VSGYLGSSGSFLKLGPSALLFRTMIEFGLSKSIPYILYFDEGRVLLFCEEVLTVLKGNSSDCLGADGTSESITEYAELYLIERFPPNPLLNLF